MRTTCTVGSLGDEGVARGVQGSETLPWERRAGGTAGITMRVTGSGRDIALARLRVARPRDVER